MDHQKGTYFGIDLGTTNTVISKGNVLFNGLIQSQIIQVMQVDENKDLVIYIGNNYSASFESVMNDPRAIVTTKVTHLRKPPFLFSSHTM